MLGFLRRAFGRTETKATSTDTSGAFYNWATTDAGAEGPGPGVSPERARGLSAVWACVGILAEDVAKLPVKVYRAQANGAKQELADHPAALVLNAPNPLHTGFELREHLVGSCALRGNGYLRKELTARGEIGRLWPLDPRQVTVTCSKDRRELFYRLSETNETLPAEMVVHLRWRSADGLVGLSPVRELRETLGLGLSAQRFAARTFDNSAQAKGALELSAALTPDAVDDYRRNWELQHKGTENAGRIGVLQPGAKWVNIGLSLEDAQFIEQRRFTIAEIARIWRMPAHKIGDLEKATFSNIEQQSIEYVVDTLLAWVKRIEERLQVDLLSADDRAAGIYIRLQLAGLLRGDMKSRAEALDIQRRNGVISANDWRRIEDMDPIAEADGGDEYWRPVNIAIAGEPPEAPAEPADPAPPAAPPKRRNGQRMNGASGHA